MAPSKSQYHVRSNSFPTRPHPLFQQCDEHLSRLGAFDAKLSSSSVAQKLSGLEDLHDCVERLFQLPLTQQAFVGGRGEKWVDGLVDASLRLLDMCSAAKDAVLHTKECAREVQSTMRRRRDQVGLACEVGKYFASRKVVKKAARKALDSHTKAASKAASSPTDKEYSAETVALIGVLRDVEATTLAAFESLLLFVSGSKTQARVSGWALVSKLVNKKKVSCEEEDEADANEFAKVDSALQGLESGKVESDAVQSELQSLEMCVQDFEEKLERLFRRLIKIRVALLNILNY